MRADHLGDIPGQASREELLAQARNLGLEGATSMSKAELQKEMQKAGSK